MVPRQRELRRGSGKLAVSLFVLAILPGLAALPAGAEDRSLVSGPFYLTLRAGTIDDSQSLGAEGGVDYLGALVNVHLWANYDWLNAGRGIGEVDNKRYGAGGALSHTFSRKANLYAGTSFVNELGENFGHVYLGGKLKVTGKALLSASYGVGFGDPQDIVESGSLLFRADSENWAKAGVVIAVPEGWKFNAYYFVDDPGGMNISGLEGEISCALRDPLTVGFNMSGDVNTEPGVERKWRASLFATYAFGNQKGSPIDVALDKNRPREDPHSRWASGGGLAISPSSANASGCTSTESITFTVSGGQGPYTWSNSDDPNNLKVFNNTTQASWTDFADDWCGGPGTVYVTVRDSQGRSATATINVSNPG